MLTKYMRELGSPSISFTIPSRNLEDMFHEIIKERTGVGVEVWLFINTETLAIGSCIIGQDDIPEEQFEVLKLFITPSEEFITTDILMHTMVGLSSTDEYKMPITVHAEDNDGSNIKVTMSLETYKYILSKQGVSLIEIPDLTDSKYFLKCIDDSWNKHMSMKTIDNKVLAFEYCPDNYPPATFITYDTEEEYNVAIEEVPWISGSETEEEDNSD